MNGRGRKRSAWMECFPIDMDWMAFPSLMPTDAQQSLKRYLHVVVLCTLVAIINSIDRTAMSVAIMPMSVEYGWSSSAKGAISSAFNIGHMVTNLVGGWAAAIYPPKDVLSWGVVVWSLFTILTPWSAATRWLPALLLVRALMGLGEGVAFPSMQAIIKTWVPQDKRSRALSLVYSGHQIGSMVSLLLSPYILASGGVSTLFLLYGSLGFLWLAAWCPLVSHAPPTNQITHHHESGDTTEASFQAQSGVSSTGRGVTGKGSVMVMASLAPLRFRDLPWGAFLRSRPLWAIAVAHSTFGISYNLFIAWLPTYYAEQFGLNVKESSFLSILPWAAMALGTNVSGWVADALVNRKVMSVTKTRKTLQLVGSVGPGLCLLYLAAVPQKGSLFDAVTLLTLAMGLLGCQAGGFASNHQDICTRYAPLLFGITNACSSLAGAGGVYTVGAILDYTTGRWSLVLVLVAAVNFVAAAVYCLFATSEPLFD